MEVKFWLKESMDILFNAQDFEQLRTTGMVTDNLIPGARTTVLVEDIVTDPYAVFDHRNNLTIFLPRLLDLPADIKRDAIQAVPAENTVDNFYFGDAGTINLRARHLIDLTPSRAQT